jgi:hypothetical protein
MTKRTVEIPDGYNVVFVPIGAVPPKPDYDECRRQADLATGIEGPAENNAWLNIFCREINRWCAQAYGNNTGVLAVTNEPSLIDPLYVEWLGDRDPSTVSGYEAFVAACALRMITPQMMEDQRYAILGRLVVANMKREDPTAEQPLPFYSIDVSYGSNTTNEHQFLNDLIRSYLIELPAFKDFKG